MTVESSKAFAPHNHSPPDCCMKAGGGRRSIRVDMDFAELFVGVRKTLLTVFYADRARQYENIGRLIGVPVSDAFIVRRPRKVLQRQFTPNRYFRLGRQIDAPARANGTANLCGRDSRHGGKCG